MIQYIVEAVQKKMYEGSFKLFCKSCDDMVETKGTGAKTKCAVCGKNISKQIEKDDKNAQEDKNESKVNETTYYENLGEVNAYLAKKYGKDFDLPSVSYEKSQTVRQNNAHVQIYRMPSGKYEVVDYASKTDESKAK